MNPAPKTVEKTNGKRGRPKFPFDPYVDELYRVLKDERKVPPLNLTQAADYLAKWGMEEPGLGTLRNHGILTPLKESAIRKRLDTRFDPRNYRRLVAERSA